jgi:hypothetical protein
MIRFEIDHVVVPHRVEDREYIVEVGSPTLIEIYFEPWKIKPLVRTNNHLIDYWTAGVHQFDHMVRFHWDDDFYRRYFDKIMQGKMHTLKITTQEDVDYFLGINNANEDIVAEIRKYIS